jgi:phenylalanyl-tRNA synthetase beta chain
MKVSLNWLRELVELPPTVDELVTLLTMAGVEVEGIAITGCAIPNVIVAEIKSSEQHPNADRLSVCQVDDGSGVPRQIVCGAKNYKVGDKVPLALPGAQLAPDFVIKVGKLRGVESQGMMCSAKELNLAEDAEGLLILPPEAKIGTPIGELFPGDTVLDLEITPNRADLLCHGGIAREIATLRGTTVKWPDWAKVEPTGEQSLKIQIESAAPCYYSALLIEGVKIGSSPDWLRRKLEAVGLRAINNAVDVTNYVMMLAGQPAHVFDAAKVKGGIHVRGGRDGEEFLALDGRTYRLSPADLVIADDDRALAVAGVIGGEESGVTDSTRDVILEIACFNPAHIRRTARRLGLVTDSSYRFERGVDIGTTIMAHEFTGRLIADLTGATALHRKSSANNCPESVQAALEGGRVVALREVKIEALLGITVPGARIEQILSGFGLKKAADGWQVPSWRPDLTREVDLIEEIARVIGMDVIPARLQARFASASATDREYDRAMALRRACVAQGLHEARSLTLVPAEPRGAAFTQAAPGMLQCVKNPMIDDQVVLRPNLMHGLLEAVARNIRAGVKSIRLFEIGRTFSTTQPEEFSHAAIVLTGPPDERSWRNGEARDADLFDLKGVVAAVLGSETAFELEENSALALSISVKVAGECVGLAGQLWPADARALDATAPVLFAEMDLEALATAEAKRTANKYHDIPRFPAMTRDIALLAPVELSHAQIETTLRAANEPLLTNIELFDVFTDPSGVRVPADRKSLAYSLTYRACDRTLTTDEVNTAHSRLKIRLTNELGVTLRE